MNRAIKITQTSTTFLSRTSSPRIVTRYPIAQLQVNRPRNMATQSSAAPASTSSEGDSQKDSDFYSLKADKPGGKVFDFSELHGKVVLIVNTASQCGFTPQYNGLEALHQQYSKDGLVLLGFPCDQFGGQEPGNDDDILESCQLNFGVSFPLMKKGDVNGRDASEVFKYLKSQQSGFLGMSGIKWNFTKFLVDQNGRVVDRFSPTTSPETIGVTIGKLLGKSPDSA